MKPIVAPRFAATRVWGVLPLPLIVALLLAFMQDVTSGWILERMDGGLDAPSDTLQTEFLRANRLLADGRPGEALELYEALIANAPDRQSGAIHYNAGIASQSMNRLGLAKAHYLAALSFPDTREPARSAIGQLDQILPFKMAKIPRYPWQKAYDALTDGVGARMLLAAASLGLYIACLGGVLLIFTSMRRSGRWLCASGVGMFLLAIGVVGILERELDTRATAVVLRPSIPLVEDPGTGLETSLLAYEGAVATIDARRSDAFPEWYFVTLENGSSGWLRRDDLRRIFHPEADADP